MSSAHNHKRWNLPHHEDKEANVLYKGDGFCICACSKQVSQHEDFRYLIAIRPFQKGSVIFCDPNPVVSLYIVNSSGLYINPSYCNAIAAMDPPLLRVLQWKQQNPNERAINPSTVVGAMGENMVVRSSKKNSNKEYIVLDHWSPFLNHHCGNGNCSRDIVRSPAGKLLCEVRATADVQSGDVLSYDYKLKQPWTFCECPRCIKVNRKP